MFSQHSRSPFQLAISMPFMAGCSQADDAARPAALY